MDEYKQAVYVAPFSKPSLQSADDSISPLMEEVEEYLAGKCQAMLILGDSGAGKSTFNHYVEYVLWDRYKPGGPIPLFINLPGLERPEKDLIAEQLKTHRFTDTQIQELEQYRQFTLICDGYDESQLNCNLHTSNSLNQAGQRKAKMIITCRTQYLGSDYRDLFVPVALGVSPYRQRSLSGSRHCTFFQDPDRVVCREVCPSRASHLGHRGLHGQVDHHSEPDGHGQEPVSIDNRIRGPS
jgi:energy-coupling factor transporter ATP-binding protein EcfA2